MKKINKVAVICIISLVSILLLQSCGITANEDFQRGWRQGWNMTAPDEYKY